MSAERNRLSAALRPPLAVIRELDEQGGDPPVGQPGGDVAREGEVGPEDVQHDHRRPLPVGARPLGRKYSAWTVLFSASGVTTGDGNRTAETE